MPRNLSVLAGAVALALSCPAAVLAQGAILPGAGAMHRSMGGASTAAAADAAGALYWNPAVISGLPGSEVVIGGEALCADTHLGSRIEAGTFGPLGPPATLAGLTRSDSGLGLASAVGVVYRPEDSIL